MKQFSTLLDATPFPHDVSIDGLGKVASVKHLPSALSVNYRFPIQSNFKPFPGAGLNYSACFTPRSSGALAGAEIDLKESRGLALHAGADWRVGGKDAVHADLRRMDIDSKVHVNDAGMGRVETCQIMFDMSYIRKF